MCHKNTTTHRQDPFLMTIVNLFYFQFTDMSGEERQAYTGLSNITDNGPLASRAPLLSNGVGAPDSKDWRDLGKVTGVKDQGQW